MPVAVSCTNLSKRYKRQATPALDDVTFTIQAGEVIGLLGPNGAGKTTLIKLLCGVIPASAGSVQVMGLDPWHQATEAKRIIGVVHQQLTFDMFLSAYDNLEIAAAFHGLRWASVKPQVDAWIETFRLSQKCQRPVFTLSGGERRRVQVIRALMKQPQVLLLDEPSAGLDVSSRRDVWALLQQLRTENGTTIIWTSHYVEELERNCGRVMIVNTGRLARFDTVTTLVEEYGCARVVLEFAQMLDPAIERLLGVERVRTIVQGQQLELLGYQVHEQLPLLLAALQRGGLNPIAVRVIPASLEDAFLAIIAGREPELVLELGRKEANPCVVAV